MNSLVVVHLFSREMMLTGEWHCVATPIFETPKIVKQRRFLWFKWNKVTYDHDAGYKNGLQIAVKTAKEIYKSTELDTAVVIFDTDRLANILYGTRWLNGRWYG
jgi:hypothetical protein